MAELSEGKIKRRLQQMDPYKFEEVVAEIWELQGYQTTVRKGSGDRGIDIEAVKQSPFPQKVLIQAKRYAEGNKVGSNDVRKYATLHQQVPDADNVVIISTSEFTSEAERLAKDLKVKLVDGEVLLDLIKQHSHNLDVFNNHFDEKVQKSVLEAKIVAKTLSDRLIVDLPTLDENIQGSYEDVPKPTLEENIQHIYETAPEIELFKWPVDKLGKCWISNTNYLSIHYPKDEENGYPNSNYTLLQYVISNKDGPTARLKFRLMLGSEIEHSDVESELSHLERKYGCEVIECELIPGTTILLNELVENHNLKQISAIISFIREDIYGKPHQEPEFEFKKAQNQISLLCPNCGNLAEDSVSFCQNCGYNLENEVTEI